MRIKQLGAGVATGALAFGLSLTGAMGAAAANASDGTAPADAWTNGDTAKLTLTKHETPRGGYGDGKALTTAPAGAKVPGVTYSVEPIVCKDGGTTLTVADAKFWDAVKSLQDSNKLLKADDASLAAAGCSADMPLVGPFETDDDGQIIMNGMALGLYRVTETGVKAGYEYGYCKDTGTGVLTAASESQKKAGNCGTGTTIVQLGAKAPAFLVTLPWNTSEGAGTKWLYNVNVYPKNNLDSIVKNSWVPESTVDGAVSIVEFKIQSAVNNDLKSDPAPGEKFTQFVVADNGAEVTAGTGTVVADRGTVVVKIPQLSGTDRVLADTEYVLDRDTNTTAAAAKKANSFTVTINNTGGALDQLTAVGQAGGTKKMVTVTFNAEVTGPVTVDNDAFFEYKHNGGGGGKFESNTTKNKFGELDVVKVDAAGDDLAGATFSLYDQACGTSGPAVGAEKISTIDPTANGNTADFSWTSLPLAQNAKTDGGTTWSGSYCLVEDAAPAGHNKPSTPYWTIAFGTTANDVVDGAATITVNAGTGIANGKVVNTADTFNLPFTGGTGTILLSTIGAGILLGGGAAIIRSGRKEAA